MKSLLWSKVIGVKDDCRVDSTCDRCLLMALVVYQQILIQIIPGQLTFIYNLSGGV